MLLLNANHTIIHRSALMMIMMMTQLMIQTKIPRVMIFSTFVDANLAHFLDLYFLEVAVEVVKLVDVTDKEVSVPPGNLETGVYKVHA